MKLNGNRILVTGAGTGMGLAAAKQLTALGNEVLMVARNEERLCREAARLENAGVFACDLSDPAQITALVEHVRENVPDLNWVFLNAGVTHTYKMFGTEDTIAFAAQEMETNYLSAVRILTLLEPVLAQQIDPAFILTTSGTALVPDISNPTYSATKAALHSLAQSARLTLQRKGSPIKVFEILAPLVDSPFAKDVPSEHKLPPADVIRDVLADIGKDVAQIHPGPTSELYRVFLQSPEEALDLINGMTNA
ncbi:SDR family NAD(P)-dependent oxidoreductase [Actinomadura soli]|uniref:SDR family NAD(P)-dependent oxidoreductase n=1 Tax=Actinomadura soli TaxID=2508997 RepID=A0A5C4J2U2_9ACTN|nr:SDR family NAD(P)-dependent oxidoreductase [Actinomadura soli]TMQ90967.1 SDR family NAD(P)-dependent oxidoreductase [Actinomadura soli]